jgi:glycosyltransferase involved in cell wall biosynthesis
MLKLSIITINLNNAQGLQKTIASVINQTFTDYEYIIIDGGSTDGSVEIIKQYANKATYWVSEPDKGIYNAMNKGIKQAKGEYCLFLNSGDWLINNSGLQQFFALKPTEDIAYCDIKTEKGINKYPDKLNFLFFLCGSIGHPAAFIKTKLFTEIGLYNENRKIVSDWEFFLKAIFDLKCSYKHYAYILTFFDLNGISTTNVHFDENSNALSDYFAKNDCKQLVLEAEEFLYYKDSKLVQYVYKLQHSAFYCKLYKWSRKIRIKK